MKTYGVEIPFTGYIYVEVEAKNTDEAKEKAFDTDFDKSEIMSLDYHEHITKGNICNAAKNDIEVFEVIHR